MKVYLITGNAGFIGSHLAEAIAGKGDMVVGVDNFCDFYNPKIKESNIKTLLQHPNFIQERVDIRNKVALEDVFKKHCPDTVIHFAAMAGVRNSIDNPILYNEVNIQGSINIWELMKEAGVKKMVFASSSSVYGNNKKLPFSENDNVDKVISPYAGTKKSGEVIGYIYHHLYNIDMMMLRFFTVYGERQRPDLAIHKFTEMILKGEPIPFYGDGTTRRDYTYIGDIVDGVMKAINYVEQHNNIYEIINLGESKAISLEDMVTTLEKSLNKRAKINTLPMQAGDVQKTYADISKAKNLIGYNPKTSLEQGISYFIKWYNEMNNQVK